jgi:prepilin-type N-terminal cleavage/methylation domain-containing protein
MKNNQTTGKKIFMIYDLRFTIWEKLRASVVTDNRKSSIINHKFQNGFTLIELLVVISIIAVLAAFIFPVAHAVKRYQYIKQTTAEMHKLETAIDGYYNAYRFYPPSGANSLVNPLYFELIGTTTNSAGYYVTLDSSAQIKITDVPTVFSPGVNGFVNCTKGSGEDAVPAKNFLSGLKPQQIGTITNSQMVVVTILLGSAGGPDQNYQPFNASDMNPWRYVSPGVNNPGSYDLWMQLVISGQTNLICNWSKQVQINYPLP